jgi:hypothetical protein
MTLLKILQCSTDFGKTALVFIMSLLAVMHSCGQPCLIIVPCRLPLQVSPRLFLSHYAGLGWLVYHLFRETFLDTPCFLTHPRCHFLFSNPTPSLELIIVWYIMYLFISLCPTLSNGMHVL